MDDGYEERVILPLSLAEKIVIVIPAVIGVFN